MKQHFTLKSKGNERNVKIMNGKIFRKRLKDLRKERGWTTRDTDLMTGMHGFTSHFEEGLSLPQNIHIRKYASAFNVAPEYLKGETDDRNYNPPNILGSVSTEDLINELKRRVLLPE
jgi:transcriptional regulator with XRE-family HTH domain